MNLRQVANLAVARLGLPIPMGKLATIHAVAQAIECDDTAMAFAEALADWVATRELESQCLEAICPLLAVAPKPEVIALVRRAIGRPSIASDALLALVTGSPVVVPTWTGCHSGPATNSSVLDEEEAQLRAGTFIPQVFTDQFQGLESQSGFPFMRQWAYEYKMLTDRYGRNGDGHLDYFRGSDRERVGQFVAHRSHLARSAFLRTLAFAVEHWGMPALIASGYAEAAFPTEPIFMRFPPQCAPEWACIIQSNTAADVEDPPSFARKLIESLEAKLDGKLMHCSLSVVKEPRCQIEFEVFAIGGASDSLDAEQVVGFHRYLLGRITAEREALEEFVCPDMGDGVSERLGFMPLLVPLIGYGVGYLQSDLVGRVPYVPASSASLPYLKLVPVCNGAVFRADGRDVGSWNWWRWNWKPTHLRDQPAPIACCASLSHDAVKQLARDFDGDLEHVWCTTTWTRENDYGEWTEAKSYGRYRG